MKEKMKLLIKNYKDIFLSLLLTLTILLSVIYGQTTEAYIGNFPIFNVFGNNLPLYLIILIPILITILYGLCFYLINKNNIHKALNESLNFIIVLTVLFIYMLLVISLRNFNHLFSDPSKYSNLPSIQDRISGICSFFLSLLMIYSFYYLYKASKNYKLLILILASIVIVFSLITIGYSLIVELDKYITFFDNLSLIDKTTTKGLIVSFFGLGNVFGHYTFFTICVLVLLSILFKKHWIMFFSFFFAPFVFFSLSRAGIVSTFLLYLMYFIYLIVFHIKEHHKRGYIYLSILLILVISFILEVFVFKLFHYTKSDNEIIYIKDLLAKLFNGYYKSRGEIIANIYSKANILDYIFGVGYGNQFIIPRTYGYIYYFHNSFLEIFSIGGIFYSLFILGLYLCSVYRGYRLYKYNHDIGILSFIFIISIPLIIYSLYESFNIGGLNFIGFGVTSLLILVPNFEYQNMLNRIKEKEKSVEDLQLILPKINN